MEQGLETCRPDFILISAGFDVMAGDPLGGMLLEPEDLHALTREVMAGAAGGSAAGEPRELATREPGEPGAGDLGANGPGANEPQPREAGSDDARGVGVVATLEGGYDPARTGLGAAAVLRALAGIDRLG